MDKNQRMIEAAIAVFSELGIEKAKVSDIVKRAGVAQGTFYLYFPSKLAVMPAIAEVMVDKMIHEIEASVKHPSFYQQLEELVDVIFTLTRGYRDIFALIYAGLASTEYLKEWEAIYAPYYAWMTAFLENGKSEGVIRPSVNSERTGKLIIGLIESAAEQVYLYDSTDTCASTQKQEVLDFLRHALASRA